MPKHKERIESIEETPGVHPGNYSPVSVQIRDTMGAIFLGLLSVILLVGWLRAEGRYRALLESSAISEETIPEEAIAEG